MSTTNNPDRPLTTKEKLAKWVESGPDEEAFNLSEKRRQELAEERRAEAVEDAGADGAALDREYTHNPPEEATLSEPEASLQDASTSAGDAALEAAAATNDRDAGPGHTKSVRPARGGPPAGSGRKLTFEMPEDWFRARADLADTLRLHVGVPFIWEVEEAIENLAKLKKQGAISKACEEAGVAPGNKRYQFASGSPEMAQFGVRLSTADNEKVLTFLKANKGLRKTNIGLLIIRNILLKYGYMTEDGQIADPYPELQFET